MTDIEAIRARHVLYAADPTIMRTDDDPQWCAECDTPWPCDTAVVLAALDEKHGPCHAYVSTLRADANALAVALRDIQHTIDADYYASAPTDLGWVRDRAEEAADAHDAIHPPENTANIPLKETR